MNKLVLYAQLMRLHRPIGIYLVVWPTLWALWLAAEGMPQWHILIIFLLGAAVMRSAGCVINDFADRKVDGHVARTQNRPMATGEVSTREALVLFILLCIIAFILVIQTNLLTIKLSVGALFLATIYPFMKRYTHLPQVVLGAAFAWSIPMAFAAETGELNSAIWWVYATVVIWTVAYDTFYAMTDREDDIKVGVKSTAILFGNMDRVITAALQVVCILGLYCVGRHFALGWIYLTSLGIVSLLFAYQQFLIRNREPQRCFSAFLNNNWVGMVVFAGIALDYVFR